MLLDELLDVHDLHALQRVHEALTPHFLPQNIAFPKILDTSLDRHRHCILLYCRHHRSSAILV